MAIEGQQGFWARLARLRVPLGFAAGVVALVFARPTPRSLLVGLLVAAAGEALRVWAAGHLEKSREVTQSGPYRFTRHPLYVGSALMGVGLAVAANHLLVWALVGLYLSLTIHAAISTEEAWLRQAFGDVYDRYATGVGPPVVGRFSLARAWRNREWRAILGLGVAFGLLVLRSSLR